MTAIGEGPDAFWEALLQGRCGVRRLTRTDADRYRNPLGYEVPLPDPLVAERPDLGRGSALMLRTARAAVEEAGLAQGGTYAPDRIGVVVGSALLDLRVAEDMLCGDGPSADFVANFNMSATVARAFGFTGGHVTFANACGAGAVAVAVAADLVEQEELDCAVAIGVDTITESMFGLADRANPRLPPFVAPFDRSGAGPLLGEGAAALILEREQNASRRGARLFGELLGAGIQCDAMSTHAPCEEGVSVTIAEALRRAVVLPSAIDYVCAHGTGTEANDRVETRALKRVLGERALQIPVSSIKSMVGHTSGASAAIAIVASLMAIETGVAPPTIHLTECGDGLDLNYVPNRPQVCSIDTALVNGFGFGGNNCCVVVRRSGRES
jgi:3-oxoacyl-[acyl-carrier-protein] synthase II